MKECSFIKNRAFTLAEVLLVLGIVGVVSTLLTGVVGQILPNRSFVMLKSSYVKLENIVDSLLNNDDWYAGNDSDTNKIAPGDFSYLVKQSGESGSYGSREEKFCKGIIQSLDHNSETCGSTNTITAIDGVIWTISQKDNSTMTVKFTIKNSKKNVDYSFYINNTGRITPATATEKNILNNYYKNR